MTLLQLNGSFLILTGSSGARVERREAEFAGDQEAHGARGGEAGVAAGIALGRPEEAVEASTRPPKTAAPVRAVDSRRSKPAADNGVDADRQRLSRRIKIDVPDG